MEATIEVDDLKGDIGKKKTKEVPGYPGLWTFIFGLLYFALAGFTCYSSYILYDQFVERNAKKVGTWVTDDLLGYMDTPTVIYFSLTMIIAINSLICSYLFFIKDVNSYKILLFNCILGLTSFTLLTPMILALKHKDVRILPGEKQDTPIYPLVSASVGLFLSGIITVKMLWKNIPDYE